MEEVCHVVPHAHPSRTLRYAYIDRSRCKGAFGFPGATWDCFRCTVELSSGHISGKEKAHEHKQIFPVTARGGGSPDRVGGGVSRPVGRGRKFMCCVRNPRNINVFVRVPGREESGSRPGGSVTGVTEKLFMCQMFMCLFWPLIFGVEVCPLKRSPSVSCLCFFKPIAKRLRSL